MLVLSEKLFQEDKPTITSACNKHAIQNPAHMLISSFHLLHCNPCSVLSSSFTELCGCWLARPWEGLYLCADWFFSERGLHLRAHWSIPDRGCICVLIGSSCDWDCTCLLIGSSLCEVVCLHVDWLSFWSVDSQKLLVTELFCHFQQCRIRLTGEGFGFHTKILFTLLLSGLSSECYWLFRELISLIW